jgi:hypothetical protein
MLVKGVCLAFSSDSHSSLSESRECWELAAALRTPMRSSKALLSMMRLTRSRVEAGRREGEVTVMIWVRKAYDFVVLVVGEGEAVVEEEARVALLAIGVEDLAAGGDVPEALNHEALGGVAVVPAGLLGHVVVQHVGQRHHRVRLHALHHHSEHSRAHQQPRLYKPLVAESSEGLVDSADSLIVSSQLPLLALHLLEEAGALEFCQQVGRVVDGEVAEVGWEGS